MVIHPYYSGNPGKKNMIFIYPYENGLITIPKMAIYRIQFFDF